MASNKSWNNKENSRIMVLSKFYDLMYFFCAQVNETGKVIKCGERRGENKKF